MSDMNEGTIGSMNTLGITESYKLKRQVLLSASEAAEMIIRFVTTVFCYRHLLIRSQGGRHSSLDPSKERSSINICTYDSLLTLLIDDASLTFGIRYLCESRGHDEWLTSILVVHAPLQTKQDCC